jgi:IclR family transcriptional regulator, pca regulon regulatory protein
VTVRADYLATTVFEQITARTVTDPAALERELIRVDRDGYGWIDGELDPAICGIAVPVRDQAGRVVAAISINTISGTLSEEQAKEKYLVPLRRTAQDICMQASQAG